VVRSRAWRLKINNMASEAASQAPIAPHLAGQPRGEQNPLRREPPAKHLLCHVIFLSSDELSKLIPQQHSWSPQIAVTEAACCRQDIRHRTSTFKIGYDTTCAALPSICVWTRAASPSRQPSPAAFHARPRDSLVLGNALPPRLRVLPALGQWRESKPRGG